MFKTQGKKKHPGILSVHFSTLIVVNVNGKLQYPNKNRITEVLDT